MNESDRYKSEHTLTGENPLVAEKKEEINNILEADKNEKEKKNVGKKRGPKPKIKKGSEELKNDEKELNHKITEEMAQLADMAIAMTNTELAKRKLTPLNPIQSMLIKTGMIGCGLKYGLSMDNYPEINLAGGVGWATMDKLEEYKKLQLGYLDEAGHVMQAVIKGVNDSKKAEAKADKVKK